MSATLLKKMSAKQIVSNLKDVLRTIEKDGEIKEIYRVWGSASGIKEGESDFGVWSAFVGQFGAINLVTGEEFSSGKCFLPDPLPDMLKGALAENDSVEFALSVSMIRRDDLGCGYEYQVKPLVEARQADPLAHLKAAATGKALPAPTAEAAKDDAPAEEEPAPKKGGKK